MTAIEREEWERLRALGVFLCRGATAFPMPVDADHGADICRWHGERANAVSVTFVSTFVPENSQIMLFARSTTNCPPAA